MTRIEPYFSKYLNKPIFIRYMPNGNGGERTLVGFLIALDDGFGKLLISSKGRASHIAPSWITEDYVPVGRVEP